MSSGISREDVTSSLAEINAAQLVMRQVICEHRGHYHLWVWGLAWILMPLTAHFGGDDAARHFPIISGLAGALSFGIGITQRRQIRNTTDHRFLAVSAVICLFALAAPFVLRVAFDVRAIYTYTCLVTMQLYVVAGLWVDRYLLWLGLVVTALVLLGFFAFNTVYWLWMAVFGGGTLFATGFYIRRYWLRTAPYVGVK
jgi:hypothetical protein